MLYLYRMSPLGRWLGGRHTVQVSTLFKLNPPLVLLGLLQMHRMQLKLLIYWKGETEAPQDPFNPPIASDWWNIPSQFIWCSHRVCPSHIHSCQFQFRLYPNLGDAWTWVCDLLFNVRVRLKMVMLLENISSTYFQCRQDPFCAAMKWMFVF